MSKMGKFKVKGMKEFTEKLNKLQDPDAFVEACAKELAQRLYRELIMNTPYITHTLQRGWTIGQIEKTAGGYKVEIINPVEYASYVEFGHRTPNHKGWVPGVFFVEKAVGNIDQMSKPLLEKRMNEYLGELMKG